jgi:protein gp37
MAGPTKIEWADKVWNPVRGCSWVSAGCQHCYAETQAARFCGQGRPFHGFVRRVHGKPHWTGKVELIESALAEPLHWRKPATIFVNSMSDLWHEHLPIDDIAKVYAIMGLASEHTFLVLTKRAQHRRAAMDDPAFAGLVRAALARWMRETGWSNAARHILPASMAWPLPNVWEGVSVENQATADARLPHLLRCAALGWQTFVSYEPALGPVDWEPWFSVPDEHGELSGPRCAPDGTAAIKLIIAGGESGPGARPAHPDWFRATRDECAEAGVPFFFKQWGEWAEVDCDEATHLLHLDGSLHPTGDYPDASCPRTWCVSRIGKRAAGRLLDGREHNDLPWRAKP